MTISGSFIMIKCYFIFLSLWPLKGCIHNKAYTYVYLMTVLTVVVIHCINVPSSLLCLSKEEAYLKIYQRLPGSPCTVNLFAACR